MAPKKTSKRPHLVDEWHAEEPSSSSAGPTKRQGIRQRLELPTGGSSSSRGEPSLGRGIRQRIADEQRETAGGGDLPEKLPFNQTMKQQWAKGELSSPQVQKISEGMMAQHGEGVDRMAAAGGSGKHPQNMQRALISCFGKPAGTPDMTYVRIPSTKGTILHPVFFATFVVPVIVFICASRVDIHYSRR